MILNISKHSAALVKMKLAEAKMLKLKTIISSSFLHEFSFYASSITLWYIISTRWQNASKSRSRHCMYIAKEPWDRRGKFKLNQPNLYISPLHRINKVNWLMHLCVCFHWNSMRLCLCVCVCLAHSVMKLIFNARLCSNVSFPWYADNVTQRSHREGKGDSSQANCKVKIKKVKEEREQSRVQQSRADWQVETRQSNHNWHLHIISCQLLRLAQRQPANWEPTSDWQ